jgi:hypothetical protein
MFFKRKKLSESELNEISLLIRKDVAFNDFINKCYAYNTEVIFTSNSLVFKVEDITGWTTGTYKIRTSIGDQLKFFYIDKSSFQDIEEIQYSEKPMEKVPSKPKTTKTRKKKNA